MVQQKKIVQWQDYQEQAAVLFRRMGLEAVVEEVLRGARGKHKVDVVCRGTFAGVPTTWIVECKHWKTSVGKAQVLTLTQVAQDVGADRAFLLSEKGFQAGAISSAKKTNVSLTSLEELQASAADSIAELSIRNALSMSKRLEESLREILFDLPARTPPTREFDETATLLGACLEITLATVAALSYRFPVILPGMFSDQRRTADDLGDVASALHQTVRQVASRFATLKRSIAKAMSEPRKHTQELVRLSDELMGKGDILLASDGDAEEEILQSALGTIKAVGDCLDTLRDAPSLSLRSAIHSLARQLWDGAYLWFGDTKRSPEAWDQIKVQTREVMSKLVREAR